MRSTAQGERGPKPLRSVVQVVNRNLRKWGRSQLKGLNFLGDLPHLLEQLLADDAAVLRSLITLGQERIAEAKPSSESAVAETREPRPTPADLGAAPGLDQGARYDQLTVEIIKRVLKPDSVCIDVGCHTGELLRQMIGQAPRGKFHAFEPLPDFHRKLVEAFASDQVKIYEVALSDRAGESTFNYVVTNPGYSGLQRRRYDRPVEKEAQITVNTRRLDELLDPSETVAFIKIDVEGAELQVLRGAIETIRRCKPVIVFEHGLGAADCYGTTPEDVFDLLGSAEMAVSTLDGWLTGAAPLSRAAFADDFRTGRNYYFLAHPSTLEEAIRL